MQYANSSSMNKTSHSVGNQIGSAVMGLCFALGIPGNIMTIVFICYLKKDNFSLHLMLNLATSDMLCLMTVPVWIYYLLNEWIFGSAFCKVLFTLGTIFMNTSVLTVTLMSVHRYLVVLHRQQWAKLGWKGERVLLLCIWVVACALSIPTALTANTKKGESKWKCYRQSTSDEERLTILSFEFLLAFVVPFSILVTCYCCLSMQINKTVFFRNQQLNKLVTRIIVTFFLFSFPVYLMSVVEILALAFKPIHPNMFENIMAFYNTYANIAISLIFLNSCVNPFLYAFASKSFLKEWRRENKVNDAI